MRKAYKLLRYAIYVLEIYFLYSLEQTPNFSFNFYGARPLHLVAGFISIILYENKFVSLAFGILIGLLMDLIVGNVLGIYTLILGILGYFLSIVFECFIKINLISAVLVTFLVSSIIVFVNSFIVYFFYGIVSTGNIWSSKYIPIVLYTCFAAVPVYLFNRTVFYFTRERKNEILRR